MIILVVINKNTYSKIILLINNKVFKMILIRGLKLKISKKNKLQINLKIFNKYNKKM